MAKRAVFCIAAFPTAFFFSAAYPEGLFLLLSVTAAYCARTRAWTWAAFAGALASATRPLGVLVWIIVLFEWLESHDWKINAVRQSSAWRNLQQALRKDYRSLIMICLIPSGLLAYMLYLQITFGNALAFFTAQQTTWGHHLVGAPAVVAKSVSDIFQYLAGMNQIGPKATFEQISIIVLNVVTFFAVLITAVPVWRRMGTGYAIYMTLSVIIPMSSEDRSLARYAMVLFPMFIAFAWWGRRRWANVALLMIFVPFLFFFSTLFFKWVIVG